MLHSHFEFVGFKAGLAQPTAIIPFADLPKGGEGKSEWYASVYRFPREITTLESLGNIPDGVPFYADYLVFDLDAKDLHAAHHDAVSLKTFVEKMGAHCEVYFSGSKGYHILVPTCQFGFVPTSDETILKKMATFIGSRVRSFDPSIYNKSRVLRLADTINAKTGLYKVAVPDLETMDVSDVLAYAKEPSAVSYPPPWEYSTNAHLVSIYEASKQRVIRQIQETEPLESGLHRILKPAKEGQRNTSLYCVARDLAKRGIYEADAKTICDWWAKDLCDPPLERHEVSRTVRSAYKKGMNELETENPDEFIYSPIRALEETRARYKAMAKSGGIRTGYDFLDKYTMGFFPGDVTFIIAQNGNFKTAILSNILQGISANSGKPTIFFSMEMGVEALTTRHTQKAEKLSQFEVMRRMREDRGFPDFENAFKNVHIVDKSSLNTARVVNILEGFLQKYGEIGAIGFDYMSLFDGCANNTERTARMATELKTIVAKVAKCPVFCLVQAKRDYAGNNGDCEIDKQAGKDSSSIEDSGDFLIGVWGHWERHPEFENDTKVKNMYGRFLKSRRFMSEHFEENPYFAIDLEKEYMNVRDIRFLAHQKHFKQKESHRE